MGTENHTKPQFAKFRVEYMPGRGYYVAAPGGARASCFHNTIDAAVTACEAAQEAHDAANKRRVRPCLCCRQPFASEGIHNRMCTPCRARASNDDPVPFSFGAIHGRKRA